MNAGFAEGAGTASVSVSEAFDEPLTKAQANAIVTPFPA